jgi:hypothetical protein
LKTPPVPFTPLPLWKAILLFAGTCAPIYIGIYYLIPILQNKGLSFLASYLISFYPTFVINGDCIGNLGIANSKEAKLANTVYTRAEIDTFMAENAYVNP